MSPKRAEQERKHVCNKCGAGFTHAMHLGRHWKTRHGTRARVEALKLLINGSAADTFKTLGDGLAALQAAFADLQTENKVLHADLGRYRAVMEQLDGLRKQQEREQYAEGAGR